MNVAENAWDAAIRMSHAVAKKKVGGIFFTSMSVAHAEDEEEEVKDAIHAEKVLSNGDFYTGEWIEHLPHGYGKYLWRDGCMYVGEWFHGKTMGKGRFSWPSGATYEGEFKNGYMDGHGTYTGASGVTYRGSWVMNQRQGHGSKSYVNGDFYEGEWFHGLQEGHGRYQWNNGNNYVGKWMKGEMGGGNGTMVWDSSGNSYEGWWEEGVPRGNGAFRWSNGSFYVGIWGKDEKQQSGTYYPSDGVTDWDQDLQFSLDMGECKVCPCEKVSVFPSQKVFCWDEGGESLMRQNAWWIMKGNGYRNKPKRKSVDARIGGLLAERPSCEVDGDAGTTGREAEDGCGFMQHDDFDLRGGRLQQLRIRQMKRQGDTICKGHKNYELMLNLQLGIRHSVGRPAPASSLDLKASAFDPKEKVWTKFPSEGSKYTPPHQSSEFKWKDYCPLVFRTLRKLFQVDPADYMLSICGNDALRELCSPGKSGSFFYLTNDDRYMIKTVKKAEVKVLLRMLPEYYKHVRSFTNTLVTRFFGLHCVKLTGTSQKKVRFVIMGNLFCSEYTIHRRYDLKGSSHGRITERPEAEVDATTTLKDLDLNFLFRLHKAFFYDFCRQVDRDCDFLEQERIMDYSLLVGLHFREAGAMDDPHSSIPHLTHAGNGDTDPSPHHSTLYLQHLSSCGGSPRLGVNMSARAERTIRRGENEGQLISEPTGEFYDIVLFFGIIDILQDYDISKKLEHAYKSMQYDPTSISAVDPKQYARRFRDFIFKVFAEDVH